MLFQEKNLYVCRTGCRDFFVEWGERHACVRDVAGKHGQHVLPTYAAFCAA